MDHGGPAVASGRRARRVVRCAGMDFVVDHDRLMRTGLDAGNGKGTDGSERRGDDVDQQLISCSNAASVENPSTKKITAGVGIQHRTGHRGFVMSEGSSRIWISVTVG